MSYTTSQPISKARNSTARPLAFFLTLSVIEGLYFPRELLFFGLALSVYILINYLFIRSSLVIETSSPFGLTDLVLLGMFFFSLLGLLHPIKVQAGLLEALRWGIYWLAYRWGVKISSDKREKQRLVHYLGWLAVLVACVGWVPDVGKVGGRLSSVFGYPNAAAAFLGAVLLLHPSGKPVRIILAISLLGTGSRAGVGLCLAVLIGQQILLGFPLYSKLRHSIQARKLKELGVALTVLSSIVLMFFYNQPVWHNLTTWGFSSASWQERLIYFKDGLSLAWNAGGLPQAGGWMAFSTVQRIPYWTADPHSSFIHILLNQGIFGLILMSLWMIINLKYARKYREETNAPVQVWGALLFLGLHSLVDTDFSFPALGFLFWLLYGSIVKRDKTNRPFLTRPDLAAGLGKQGVLMLSLTLCLFCGSTLINPDLLEKEQSWNKQAIQWREQDPAKSLAFWDMSLHWDQTQVGPRREQAELLLSEGNVDAGLKAIDAALFWQPLNLEMYEWAQSTVWDTAEMQRRINPEKAAMLYRWVANVPQRIEERVRILNPKERLLWPGCRDFQPSQHIKLLADYAKQK